MMNRDTVLISCDTHQGRVALCSVFEKNHNVLQASNIHQAAMLLKQNAHCICGAVIDMTAFEDFGADVLDTVKRIASNPDIPVFLVLLPDHADRYDQMMELGIYDIVTAPFSETLLHRRLQNAVDLNLYRFHVDEYAKEQAAFLQRSNEAIVDTLSSIIEYRSLEDGCHNMRIRRFTELLLREVAHTCPEYDLDEETIQMIASAASLHDIGKIFVPDAILNKPGPLTPQERLEIQKHTTVGHNILESLVGSADAAYLNYACQITRYHHERWDGRGYPDGLKGDQIPLCAQIVGLTDAYDALTSKRVYKEAYPLSESVNMILNGECGAFSPKLLECFKQVAGAFADLALSYRDEGGVQSEKSPAPRRVRPARPELDTMQLVQAKYQAMLHYTGATVLEMDFDQSTYHVVYNPDPNLLVFNSIISFKDLVQTARENVFVPEDAALLDDTIGNGLETFFADGLRRQHQYFHIRNLSDAQPYLYRVTMLRIDPVDSDRRRLLLVFQNVETPKKTDKDDSLDQDFLDFAVFGALDTLHSVRRDPYLTLNRCSKDLITLLGYTPAELQTRFNNHMVELIHPMDRERVLTSVDEQLKEGVEFVVEYRALHKNGRYIWALSKGRLFTEHMGHEYLYCLLLDISKSKAAEDALQETLARQEIILAQTRNVIFECDMDGNDLYFSDKWKEMFGYDPVQANLKERIAGDSHFHPDDAPVAMEMFLALQNGSDYEERDLRIVNADGHYLWCQIRVTVQHDQLGNALKMVGVIVNINEQKRSEQELKNRAEQDALTKLLNKDASKHYIQAFLQSPDCRESSALLVIDLDNFKQVNDQYGHMFGDIIITQAADEIRRLFRTDDIVGRIGGDEFLVLMKNIPSLELLQARLEALIRVFSTTLHDRVPEADLGCSVGVSLYPQHGRTYADLFRQADQALYKAKARGKNGYQIYDASSAAALSPQKRAATSTPIDSDRSEAFTIDKLIQYTFQQLYSSGDIEQTISNMLELVGQQMNVSRTYIFENNADNTHCSNTFEWCNNGVSAEIDNLQDLSYTTDIPGYRDNFNEQGIFYCPDIKKLPKEQYDVLEPQQIKSMLQCAITDNGVFRGFVGFDECKSNRLWTQKQIDALIFFSEILSTFLLKKRAQDETECRAQNLSSVLENQNTWTYVIDPDTYKLLFVNERTKQLSPAIGVGAHCHSCIMGLDQPCPGCPAKQLHHQKHSYRYIYNSVLDLHAHVEGACIKWNGTDAYLITCREAKPPTI